MPQPDGTVRVTYELAAKSLPAGAVKVNTSELPVDPAVTDVGATVIVPSPLAATVVMTMVLLAPSEPAAARPASVRVALLPTPSLTVPPFRASDVVAT